ncbi:MAG: hypothetical protein L6305_07940 [Actinomycetia bacterium]|nr:hypothetical protein [bacterium]MCG2791660.1 hypothetical protein [Actinomycetes bacterium]
MKRNIFILLIVSSILIVFSTLIFASGTIDVKDYIKGKFPVIFNIYLAPLGELDEYEKEFIDLLQNLPEEEQKNFAKEVYNNGFSKEILEKIKKEGIITKPETEIEEKNVEEPSVPNTGKWIYNKETDPIDDTTIITFTLENEKDELVDNKPIYLILRYKGKKTDVFIDWNRELKPFYETLIYVHIRFGDNKPSMCGWNTTNSLQHSIAEALFGEQSAVSQYTFYPRYDIKFIRKLMDNDRFVAQLKSRDKMTLTAEFDTRGLRNAIEQFNDILHWIKD